MVCFVVLHYLSIDETSKCVNSIFNIKGDKKIIIVDNASPNNSGMELKKTYSNNNDVITIINEENLGFAKGNNIGYYEALKYNPDFIVVMNNDVELPQEDFIDRITNIYNNEKYAILSPDVYSTYSKIHQSPKSVKPISEEKVYKEYKKYKFRKKSKIIIPIKCMLKEISFLKKILQSLKFKSKGIDYNKKYYNVPVHGSIMIFSKEFINNRKYAFNPATFMYYESEILNYECNLIGLKTVYDPSIKAYHHHSVSSSASLKSELKRERFTNKNVYNSLSEFINIIEKNKKNKEG